MAFNRAVCAKVAHLFDNIVFSCVKSGGLQVWLLVKATKKGMACAFGAFAIPWRVSSKKLRALVRIACLDILRQQRA